MIEGQDFELAEEQALTTGSKGPGVPPPKNNYMIVGTWDDWKSKHKMQWDADLCGFFYDIELGSNHRGLPEESFQLLQGGDWKKAVYPDKPDACPFVRHTLCGPDTRGHGCNWTIGKHPRAKGVKGEIYRVSLTLNEDKKPLRLTWVQHGHLSDGKGVEAPSLEVRVELGPAFEEALMLKAKLLPVSYKPEKFMVEMVLDRTPQKTGTRRPAKGALVKSVDAETEQVAIKNMPTGRAFLVAVVAHFAGGEAVRSGWLPAVTLPYSKPVGADHRDFQGALRGKCLYCSCQGYRRRREKEEQSMKEIRDSICRGCACPSVDHSNDVSDLIDEDDPTLFQVPQVTYQAAGAGTNSMQAPLFVGPPIQTLHPERFDAKDPKAWMRHLSEEGFVVIADVMGSGEIDHAFWCLWSFLQMGDAAGKVQRGDISSWEDSKDRDSGWPADPSNGVINCRGIGQSELLWFVRSHPEIRQIFASLWGTPNLVTSFDGAGVFRPYGKHPDWRTGQAWYHVDQGHSKPGLHCVQGFLTLTDADARTGGLIVVPRSHRFHNDILGKNGDSPDFIRLNDNDCILTEPECGGPSLLTLRAGDFVLWDSRTVHCNTPALRRDPELLMQQELMRAVTYVCMTPAAWCSEEVFTDRTQAIAQRVTTKHWPHEFQVVDRPGVTGSAHGCSKSEGTFTREQRQLVKPDMRSPGPMQQGMLSLFPVQSFRVCRDVVPVRSSATTEWGEVVGHVKKGTRVKGHVFGKWVLLNLDGDRQEARGEAESKDAWLCIHSEEDDGRVLVREAE